MDGALVGREYADHLTDQDLTLLISAVSARPGPSQPGPPAAGLPPGADAGWLRHEPAAIPALLADPRVFDAVFGWGEPGPAARPGLALPGQAVPVSPFLTFAVAVHRSAAELASMDHVTERTGPRQRVPLFDAPALRDFLGSPARRLFLAELLGSFTRVASGRYRVRGGGRMRTRRFSELDPVRLAGLLDGVPDADRPGVYRRLGDVCLFLSGVFPDYATLYGVGPAQVARLLRAAQVPAAQHDQLATIPVIELLEQLGARWYRAACGLAPVRTARLDVVAEVAGSFRQARRVLNHVADRYLFSTDHPWFAPPSAP
ncbi:MAG TPA: hypothetical protein VMH35_23395 [Streptosporangiaceae bacterium]|nr:hypothetical protein [Streptosporangiaceae bacterium]